MKLTEVSSRGVHGMFTKIILQCQDYYCILSNQIKNSMFNYTVSKVIK